MTTEPSNPPEAAWACCPCSVDGDVRVGFGPSWVRSSPPACQTGLVAGQVPMTARELASVGWAFAPLVTIGMAAGPCFAYAAVRRRSRALALAAVAYGALSASVVCGSAWGWGSDLEVKLGVVSVLLLWVASSAHALAVRRTVFFGGGQMDDAVVAATERIRRRDESRRIVATDPRLARELRIGRPDQPSAYDDGGLVDINHVPAECLRAIGGVDGDLADRIVATRDLVGGFDNRHDLEAVMGLDPSSLDEVGDLLIFCR